MRKILLLCGFLMGLTTAQAQIKNVSIRIEANSPFIKSVEKTNNVGVIPVNPATGYTYALINIGEVRESFESKIGTAFSGQFDYSIIRRLFISSGLSLNYLRFKRSVSITDLFGDQQIVTNPVETGVPAGTFYGDVTFRDANGKIFLNGSTSSSPFVISEKLGTTKALSVQIPLLLGYSLFKEKLLVRTGPVFSYLLYSSEVKQQYTAATGTLSEYEDTSKDMYNKFLAGINLHTTYLIGKRVGIDAVAQTFLTSIYADSDQSGRKARYNILSLGLSYNFSID